MLLIVSVPNASSAYTRAVSMLEISNGSALGTEIKVPVRVQNLTRLASGSFKISSPQGSSAFSLNRFEIAPNFDGGIFNTTTRINGDTLYVDFISSNQGNNVRVSKEVIGYIYYNVSRSASKDTQALLALEDVSLQDQNGRDQKAFLYNGTLTKERPMGDVLGTDEVSAGQAVRILQHAKGTKLLSGPDVKEAADVDGDGNIAQADAMKVLQHIVGLNESFIQVKTEQLPNVIINQEYKTPLEAQYGSSPYTWSLERGSRLPSGLRLDQDTGVISGKTTREGEYSFTIEVTDRSGSIAAKTFTVEATETNVKSIEQIDPVSVVINETVPLPTSVKVTYQDDSTKYETVNWNAVDTSTEGTKFVYGTVANTGMQISVEVVVHKDGEDPVIPEEQIEEISNNFVGILGVHTLQVKVTNNVYDVVLKAKVGRSNVTIPMHYEGDNVFSLATPRLTSGQEITIVAYDRYQEKIVEKNYQVK